MRTRARAPRLARAARHARASPAGVRGPTRRVRPQVRRGSRRPCYCEDVGSMTSDSDDAGSLGVADRLQQQQSPPSPPPLVRVRLRTFPAMMLASAAILTCEAFAINYISSPSPYERHLNKGRYTVDYHDPLVAERMLEMLEDWGLSFHNLRHIYHHKTPTQTNPPRAYHGEPHDDLVLRVVHGKLGMRMTTVKYVCDRRISPAVCRKAAAQ